MRMDCRNSWKRPGLSLIELLIGIAIVGFVSLLVAMVYLANFKLFNNQNVAIDVSNQNRIALDDMENQIREGQAVVSSCCAGSEVSSSTKLILQLWPLNATGEPCEPGTSGCTASGIYDYIVYKCEATCPTPPDTNTNILKRTEVGAGSTRQAGTHIIVSKVKDLLFTYLDSADVPKSPSTEAAQVIQIKIDLKTEIKTFTKKTPYTSTSQTKAILRNK